MYKTSIKSGFDFECFIFFHYFHGNDDIWGKNKEGNVCKVLTHFLVPHCYIARFNNFQNTHIVYSYVIMS
jgi:hypothetical protein